LRHVAWNKENFILFIQFPENYGKVISYNYEEGEQKVLLEGDFNQFSFTVLHISPTNLVLLGNGFSFRSFDIDSPSNASTFHTNENWIAINATSIFTYENNHIKYYLFNEDTYNFEVDWEFDVFPGA